MCGSKCILFLFAIFAAGDAQFEAGDVQFEGDPCTRNGLPGICLNIRRCQAAIADIKRRINPQLCSFDDSDPIVCCVSSPADPRITPPPPRSPQTPLVTTPPYSVSTTTEHISPVDDKGACSPIPPTLTSKKTGQKAWDKCIEYQEQLILPCQRSVSLLGDFSRENNCNHNVDELIVGGVNAGAYEYPHMALLGFGPKDSAQWMCGGTLISDWFILTAGHCTFSRDQGPVTFAVLGTLKRTHRFRDSQTYGIARIIKYPEYHSPAQYNDIALLKTDKQVALSKFIVPACLHTGNNVKDDRAVATGWGAGKDGKMIDILQKVTLHKFTLEECREKITQLRNRDVGFNVSTQLCYGDKTESKDTCYGDSGGPLQIKNKQVYCMWTVIGVTSFGKGCGVVSEPGVYTRVSYFLPWIESIVWA